MEENNTKTIILKDNQSYNNAYKFNSDAGDNGDYNGKTVPYDGNIIPEDYWNAIKGMRNINELLEQHRIITIPQRDKYKNNYSIFERINDNLYTYNWVGVISSRTDDGTTFRVEVHSRFDNGDNQYFLLYLLCNVYGINVFDLDINSEIESDYTAILVILFLVKISDAYSEGLYKEYVRNNYNDFSFRGSFDVNRHIRLNNPFVGKTAYSVREYSYDNDILCLLRQTIDHIIDYYPEIWNGYSSQSTILKEIVDVLETATPSYRINENYSERLRCQKEITNPLFMEYEEARKIALMILRETGQNLFDDKDDESAGVLIDIAWLWEEFISVKLLNAEKFEHLLTDGTKGWLEWAKDEKWYPDFIENKLENERRRILDAKYKFWDWYKDEDVHQLLSYLLITGGEVCGVIYPSEDYEDSNDFEFKTLRTYEGFYRNEAKIYKLPLSLPQIEDKSDFSSYCKKMEGLIDKWKESAKKQRII